MKKQATPRKRAVPIGPPLNSTDEDLDLLALVTIEDIEDAKATARQRMTLRGVALMDTERTPNE